MTFALSPLALALGLAGLAAALFLLQRLRVRHAEVPVVTTLFWRQAVEETRARVLVRRFRHWPAYLLFLVIGALLWLGFAQPRASSDAGARHVLLLDASAGMAWGDRFDEARDALLADAAGLAGDRTEVLVCGATVRTLLAPGEDPLLLERRLEGLVPVAAPGSLARALRSIAAIAAPATTVYVYGDAPLEQEGPLLADDIEVVRRSFAPERAGNRGILALGVAEAASGRWDAVDVFVRARYEPLAEAFMIGAALDGASLGQPSPGGIWRDVPARGGRFTVRVPAGDGLVLDDEATIVLPTRPVLRIGLSEDVRALFLPVIEADPGLRAVADGEADAGVNGFDGSTPSPTWINVRTTGPGDAAIVIEEPTDDPRRVLRDIYRDLLLAEIDGAALADALGRPVTVTVRDAPQRHIVLARELLRPEAGFVGSRAWPVFVTRALRRVAGFGAFDGVAVAGEPGRRSGRWTDAAGARSDPVGVPFTPPAAGEYVARDGATLHASLAAGALTAAGGAAASAGGLTATRLPPALLLVLLAFVLLLVEWMLVRRGSVP